MKNYKVGDKVKIKIVDGALWAKAILRNPDIEKKKHEIVYIAAPCGCGCGYQNMFLKVKGGLSQLNLQAAVLNNALTSISSVLEEGDKGGMANYEDHLKSLEFIRENLPANGEYLVTCEQVEIVDE